MLQKVSRRTEKNITRACKKMYLIMENSKTVALKQFCKMRLKTEMWLWYSCGNFFSIY